MSLVKNLKIEDLVAKFDIEVNKDEYLALVDKYQNQYLKEVKVDGFRPGNVPKDIALKHINAEALEGKIMEDIVKETSKPAFQEVDAEITKANRVMLSLAYDTEENKAIREDDNQNLVYSCIANLLPSVNLETIENLKVEKDTDESKFPEYTDYENSQIRNLMKDVNEYTNVEDGAKEGDKVVMSFSGALDGEAHPELASDEYTLLLGSNEFLPDFEKAIYGIKAGETKTFDVKFPSDYFSDKFAGKTVQFTSNPKEVQRPKFATIQEVIDSSEEKKQDLESEENIKNFIKSRYDQEKSDFVKNGVQSKVIETVVKNSPNFPISNDVVSQQTDRIFNQLIDYGSKTQQPIGKAFIAMGMKSDNPKIETLDALGIRSEIEENVKAELKLQYIYLTVIKTKKLDLPSPEELKVYVQQIKSSPRMYGYPEDATEEELTDMIGDNLANRKALDYLISKIAA
jgi:trigger factor